MYYLSICAIARNESLYLEEWIKYHTGIGVEHFYIYNNESTDTTSMIAKSFKNVTLKNFPGQRSQAPAYLNCLNVFKNESRYIAFIDIDEFLVPKETLSLPAILKNYEEYPALCAHWRFFGSNGELNYTNKPVVERFTKCEKAIDRHVKSIVDPMRTSWIVTVHKFIHPTPAVDEHFNKIADTDSRPEPATADIIQVNHYVTKSYGECAIRRRHPRADTGEVRELETFFHGHDKNEVEDLRALEIWNSL